MFVCVCLHLSIRRLSPSVLAAKSVKEPPPTSINGQQTSNTDTRTNLSNRLFNLVRISSFYLDYCDYSFGEKGSNIPNWLEGRARAEIICFSKRNLFLTDYIHED